MIGPTIAGLLSSATHSFNSALIGAAGVVFLGACLLLNGTKFEKKTYQEAELKKLKSNSN
jgi:cyanate permease